MLNANGKSGRPSRFSDVRNICVEVAIETDWASVCDTKRRDGSTLTIDRDQFQTFLNHVTS